MEILPNGGEVMERRPLHPKGDGNVECEIVLCKLPHNRVTPYVTWQRNTTECVGCYWGHYFASYDRALSDFHRRGD